MTASEARNRRLSTRNFRRRSMSPARSTAALHVVGCASRDDEYNVPGSGWRPRLFRISLTRYHEPLLAPQEKKFKGSLATLPGNRKQHLTTNDDHQSDRSFPIILPEGFPPWRHLQGQTLFIERSTKRGHIVRMHQILRLISMYLLASIGPAAPP